MPLTPPVWIPGQPISAKKLNTDLYSFRAGNAYAPNGILFHAQRPTLCEYIINSSVGGQTASTGGSFIRPGISPGLALWNNFWDSSAYYGPGADIGNQTANGQFTPQVPGAKGVFEVTASGGGWYLFGGCLPVSAAATSGSSGTGIQALSGAPSLIATSQLSSTTRDNAGFALDLVNPASPTVWNSVAGWEGSTTGTVASSFVPFSGGTGPVSDWSGEIGRQFAAWSSVETANGTTVGAGPSVPAAFTSATALTSTLLNTDIVNNLNFLNMPPLLRQSYMLATTIATGTVTTVPLAGTTAGPLVDTYTGYNSTTHVYTVPVSGVYLVHGQVSYTPDAGAAYQLQAGVQINALNLWGPSYQNIGVANGGTGTIGTVTRLLDLNANDTVKLITQHNRGSNTTLWNSGSAPSRLIMQWMGALGTPSTLWTNPDTGFRWQAGTPGSQLPALFNSHIQNDIGFLINKPYLLSYQTVTTGQTAFAANTTGNLIMDTASGRVHASTGDNYSGYNTGTGVYTAVRAGWYLVIGEYKIANNSSAPYPIVAQVRAPGTGHQNDPLYWCQHVATDNTAVSTMPAGSTYVNLHYLRVNDTIQPAARVQPANGTNTWGVTVVSGQESHFELIWLSQ